MKPERDYGLVDILDRLLNKGVVLNADLIITVAGVPLIGLSLIAALASVETMLDYGMMKAWDQETRDWYKKLFMETDPLLGEDEVELYKTFGYIWCHQGLISSWRPGFWYVTNKRIFLWRREPEEALFEAPLGEMGPMETRCGIDFGKVREVLNIQFRGRVASVRVSNIADFENAIKKARTTEIIKGQGGC